MINEEKFNQIKDILDYNRKFNYAILRFENTLNGETISVKVEMEESFFQLIINEVNSNNNNNNKHFTLFEYYTGKKLGIIDNETINKSSFFKKYPFKVYLLKDFPNNFLKMRTSIPYIQTDEWDINDLLDSKLDVIEGLKIFKKNALESMKYNKKNYHR